MTAALRPKKSLGQHFLRDDEIHEEILHWARLGEGDRVLEVGAGDGTITRSLARLAGRVVAVEMDRRCLPLLRKEFPAGGKVEVVEADILRFDLSSLRPLAPVKVVADLPYNIATAVLNRLLDERGLFADMVLMFQKEVALRLVAAAGSKDYGSLSVATRYRADVEIVRIVPPEAFRPPPKVDSAIVRLVPRAEPLLDPGEEKILFRLVEAGFRQRRKTLINSLARSGFEVPDQEVATALENLSLPEKVRAEGVAFGQFLDLARTFAARGTH